MTTGAFGASSLKIKGLVADGSNRQDANFGEGDTIEVLLNHETGGGIMIDSIWRDDFWMEG
jgi:hypothetical protein